MKVFIKLIASIGAAIALVAFLVLMPSIAIHKNFETKIYKHAVQKQLDKKYAPLYHYVNNWYRETETSISDLISIYRFQLSNTGKTAADGVDGSVHILNSVYQNFPAKLKGLIGIIVVDVNTKCIVDSYYDDVVFAVILSQLQKDKLLYDAQPRHPYYFEEKKLIGFASEPFSNSLRALFFLSIEDAFPKEQGYQNIVINDERQLLGLLQAKFKIQDTGVKNVVKRLWRNDAKDPRLLIDIGLGYLEAKDAEIGKVGIFIDAAFFKMSILQKTLFIALLLIAFSFIIFILLNLGVNNTKTVQDQIDALVVKIFRDCFVEQKIAVNAPIFQDKETFRQYVLDNLTVIFRKRTLRKTQPLIEQKVEEIWKNISDFKAKNNINGNCPSTFTDMSECLSDGHDLPELPSIDPIKPIEELESTDLNLSPSADSSAFQSDTSVKKSFLEKARNLRTSSADADSACIIENEEGVFRIFDTGKHSTKSDPDFSYLVQSVLNP